MRYAESMALFERAQKVTPGGAQTGSKAPGRVGPIGAFPLYLSHGEGPYVWDADGNKFVDFFMGNCAVTLGHGHPSIARAVLQASERGAQIRAPYVAPVDHACGHDPVRGQRLEPGRPLGRITHEVQMDALHRQPHHARHPVGHAAEVGGEQEPRALSRQLLSMVPCLGLIDYLVALGQERTCIQDIMAKTRVVNWHD